MTIQHLNESEFLHPKSLILHGKNGKQATCVFGKHPKKWPQKKPKCSGMQTVPHYHYGGPWVIPMYPCPSRAKLPPCPSRWLWCAEPWHSAHIEHVLRLSTWTSWVRMWPNHKAQGYQMIPDYHWVYLCILYIYILANMWFIFIANHPVPSQSFATFGPWRPYQKRKGKKLPKVEGGEFRDLLKNRELLPSGKLTVWPKFDPENHPFFLWKLVFQPLAGSMLIYWRVI